MAIVDLESYCRDLREERGVTIDEHKVDGEECPCCLDNSIGAGSGD